MAQLIVVLVIFGVLTALFILVLRATRGSLIEKMDEQGLTTKAGKKFQWADLQRIKFNLLKHRVADTVKVQAVHFYFANGQASAGYLMKNIDEVVRKARDLQVPKEEKVVGVYVR